MDYNKFSEELGNLAESEMVLEKKMLDLINWVHQVNQALQSIQENSVLDDATNQLLSLNSLLPDTDKE